MKVEFKYSLEDKVLIAVTGKTATIVGLWLDRDHIHWALVEYVSDNQIINTWFREKHLTPLAG